MDVEKLLREVRIVVCTFFVGVLCVVVVKLPDFSTTLDKSNTTIDKVNVLIDSVHKAGHKVMMDYDDPDHPYDGLYYNLQNDFYNSQQASKHLDDMVLATNKNLNGPDGVFANVNVLLKTIDTTVKNLSTDLDKLTTSTSEVLLPLRASLSNVDVLTKELAEELKSGGNIDQTVTKLNSNLDSVNVLLSDPNIALTIANGQSATASFASTAQTLDIVTLPYRKKISQVKLILGKMLDAFKFTFKVW